AIAQADAHDSTWFTSHAEGKVLRLVLHIFTAFAHEALHRIGRSPRIGQQPALRFAADDDRVVVADPGDRRHERIAALVADDERHAVLHLGDERVRSAEIDSDDFAHVRISPPQWTRRTGGWNQ